MSCTSSSAESIVSIWVDEVAGTPQELTCAPEIEPYDHGDKENVRTAKKRRIADSKIDRDAKATPRAPKRRRGLIDAPSFSNPSSPTKTSSSTSTSDLESHQSGRQSPTKQLMNLENYVHPVLFRDFDDDEYGGAPLEVMLMRMAVQDYADGIGVLGYSEDIEEIIQREGPLRVVDEHRFRHVLANKPQYRNVYGSMPSLRDVKGVVDRAHQYSRIAGTSEDEWNSKVHERILELALATSSHERTLDLQNVKITRIDSKQLTIAALPNRFIDYVVALKPDQDILQRWSSLRPLPGVSTKSWNHISKTTPLCKHPIAINFETKAPHKSWNDGQPQIAIWTRALLERLKLLLKDTYQAQGGTDCPPFRPPALPVLIAQGHDWYLWIIKYEDDRMIICGKICFGCTDTCFDALKIVAVLHWLMHWTETVWRPWFKTLIMVSRQAEGLVLREKI